jgi:hypothetical protein
LEEQWTFSSKFDFIHCRFLTVSLQTGPGSLSKVLSKSPKPLWLMIFFWFFLISIIEVVPSLICNFVQESRARRDLEVIDILFPARSDDGSLAPDSPQTKMGELGVKASTTLGRPIDSAALYKEQMEAVGFENVTKTLYKWPTIR